MQNAHAVLSELFTLDAVEGPCKPVSLYDFLTFRQRQGEFALWSRSTKRQAW